MREIHPSGPTLITPRAPAEISEPPRGGLAELCTAVGELGPKLDRIEDALHDIAQVLARAVGPPWGVMDG